MKKTCTYFLLIAVSFLSTSSFAVTPTSPSEKTAYHVSKMFYAARIVMGESKEFTADPTKFKGKEGDIKKQIKDWYAKMSGEQFAKDGPAEELIWKAIEKVITEAVNGRFKAKWADAKHFPNKMIPARFATLVTQEFNKLAGSKYKLKWTTTDEYLINPTNSADEWEKSTMQNKFKSADWKQGDTFGEDAVFEKQQAYRYMTPEYFKTSCMDCHGGAVGAELHKGKSPAGTGSFGGGLSFLMAKK